VAESQLSRFWKISEHAQKHLSVNEDVPEIQQDFSAPPDAVNDSHIPPSCGWWFLTSYYLMTIIFYRIKT